MALRLKNQVVSAFKMHGLTLRSDASKYLVEVLTPINEVQLEDILDRLIEAVQKQHLDSTMVARSVCEAAVHECNEDEVKDSESVFTVIDAFDVPRFTYVQDRKKFIPNDKLGLPAPHLHGNAKVKSELFRDRYTILSQRTLRHDLFTPPTIGAQANEKAKKFQLKPIEFLMGSTAKLGDILVLGMLTQIKEGKWFIEDPTGYVQLDLTQASFHNGLFTENCFVLAEGSYEDETFHVNAFGFPPPEPATTSRAYFGNINFFGGAGETSVKASAKLKQIEKDNEDGMMVFLSDVWLDEVRVLDKLRVLFTGYSDMPPICFVLTGNFISTPYGNDHAKTMKESLKSLMKLILDFSQLAAKSRFIFVPGPQDPGPGNILPRPPLPECLTEEFRRKIPNAIFTSNPCRIQYCTQEIVIFREDIVTKMCRNCVKFPKDGDIPTHFAKTIVCQGHLCPLPLHVAPVYWSYDNSMRVYPLPDLIVCADKFDPFHVNYVDCNVMNPGSFPRSDFSFKVYIPASRQIEDSKIGDY